MGSVNERNPKIDQTVEIFDKFNNFSINVQAQEYDIVYSYFKTVYTTDLAAANFTTALFRVANQQSVSVLTLLDQLKTTSGVELNLTMCYYLNNLRSNATLLGLTAQTQPNFYVARNVRA